MPTFPLDNFFRILNLGVHKLNKCLFNSNSGISVDDRMVSNVIVLFSLNSISIHI